MQQVVNYAGTTLGGLGALICAISGVFRLLGYYHLAGYQSTTLFIAGIGLMVFACLLKLSVLASRTSRSS